MTRRTMLITVLAMFSALSFCLFAAAPTARAEDEMEALKGRFAKRLPALNQAKAAGTIGETWQGYVDFVAAGSDEAVRKLVTDENKDRQRLYTLIAERTSKSGDPVTADQVGQQNAARNFKNAKSGEFLKTRDQGWIKKA